MSDMLVPVPHSLPRRAYARWRSWNRVLWWLSGIALTRGILYTRNSGSTGTPRGLELLPKWALFVFGLLWLAAAMLGFVGAVKRDGLEMWGRRVLGGMFMAWGFIYVALTRFYPDESSFLLTALLFGFLALLAFASKPEVRYVNLVVAAGDPAAKGHRRLLLIDRRRVNKPVAVERRRASE